MPVESEDTEDMELPQRLRGRGAQIRKEEINRRGGKSETFLKSELRALCVWVVQLNSPCPPSPSATSYCAKLKVPYFSVGHSSSHHRFRICSPLKLTTSTAWSKSIGRKMLVRMKCGSARNSFAP